MKEVTDEYGDFADFLEANPYHLFINAPRRPLYERRIELFALDGGPGGSVHLTRLTTGRASASTRCHRRQRDA
ncbi:MAG TPA: hypothetical protein VGK30_12465 [Candidatus Binatia bacterium]